MIEIIGRYFAPEYFMHGIVDEKIDIFSFGVLLLELITGRQAIDESKNSLVLWVPFSFLVSQFKKKSVIAIAKW